MISYYKLLLGMVFLCFLLNVMVLICFLMFWMEATFRGVARTCWLIGLLAGRQADGEGCVYILL